MDKIKAFEKTSEDTRFALSVAAFAELLKGSRYAKDTDIEKLIETARKAKGEDADGYRADFVKIASLYAALPKDVSNSNNNSKTLEISDDMIRVINSIRIEGIIGKEAIVNGQMVSVGSKVSGITVTKITGNSVWFKYNGYTFYLSHYPTITSNLEKSDNLKKHIINLYGHTHQKNNFLLNNARRRHT